MADKNLQELEREKLEWEIRALKRSAKSRAPWLGLLFLLNLAALLYLGSRLIETDRDETRSRKVESERMLDAVEAKETETKKLLAELEGREQELQARIDSSEVSGRNFSGQIEELKAQMEDCQALADKTWEQRVSLIEALDRIDEAWKKFPETMTFTQLKELRAVEEQLIKMRSILEDIEAPE